jgi:pyruvate dehydrogenase E2 component (dihydrolipoamide acetyltransferase)
MRRATGALMARSKQQIPHYYLGTHIDLGHALRWMEEANLERSVAQRLIPAALLLKAVGRAARDVPQMNGFCVDDEFRTVDGVHVGVATSLRGGGLIAPAIHDVDQKSLDQLMEDLRDVVERARTGTLRSSQMSDPTITITNLGDQGVETVFGVIYAPQVALVGFGRVIERPWAENGLLGVRRVVHATLSADHRVSDGHIGGRFLSAISNYLQEPASL